MKRYGILGAALCLVAGLGACSKSNDATPAANGPAAASVVDFIATDEPGPWFKCVGNGCVPAGTESLGTVIKGRP